MWVMATLRAFAFDAKMKKGVSFGLQSIMKIADDVELGGGGSGPDQRTMPAWRSARSATKSIRLRCSD